MNNNYIISKWRNRELVIEAKRVVKTSPRVVVNCHKFPTYGKLLGDNYTSFEIKGNHIFCSIPQKVAFFTLDIKFEKIIENIMDKTYIHFRTVDSAVDINGVWKISPHENGTLLELGQIMTFPKLARFIPIENIVKGKIENILDAMSKLD